MHQMLGAQFMSTRVRFTTPDGGEWEYSTEFNGYWVMFEQVDGARWVSGSIHPLREPTQVQLVETLKELWQRRASSRR